MDSASPWRETRSRGEVSGEPDSGSEVGTLQRLGIYPASAPGAGLAAGSAG